MIGRVFMGRYEAVRLLGEGGMGKVYLARQLDLGRQVVVKVMHEHVAAEPKFKQRFQRETLLMAHFAHPYAVALYDASITDGPCIVMEYVRGVNLETLLAKNKRLSPPRVNRLLGQLCEVLQAAHDQGLVHRDLKPANLMVVDHDTPREKIKVMDFGLAKMMDSTVVGGYLESSAEFAVGTPGYIPPEQVRGDMIDHRADLYSVGVMVYEMLTGRLPFTGTSQMDLMLAHATEPPPSFESLNLPIYISSAVESVVMKSLAKDPKDRFQSAREFAEYFDSAMHLEESGFAEEVRDEIPEPSGPALIHDPNTLAFSFEAWMPESIAVMKLRGFVNDLSGQIIESIPGLVRVQVNVEGKSRGGLFGFRGRSAVLNLELYLHPNPNRGNQLTIQAMFRPNSLSQLNDPVWRERCTKTYMELRGYLMGVG